MACQRRSCIIAFESLTLSLNKQIILDTLSLSVEQPEILAILGSNGAGKSSLLKLMSGELAPDSGELSVFGSSPWQWHKSALQKKISKRMAVLPQSSQLNFDFLVEDVVQLGRMPHASGLHVDNAITQHVLEKMDITHIRQKTYTQLSGGEKQRVQLARVLVQIWPEEEALTEREPELEAGCQYRLLLLDEPTSSLDIQHQHALMRNLSLLKQQGIAVVMVLHDFNLASQYADRVIVLHEQKIEYDGPPEEVFTKDMFKKVFHIESTILSHPNTQKPLVTVN